MFGAEASAAKTAAVASGEALSLANRCTVALSQASSLELVAQRLTSSCFCNHCIWPHSYIHFKHTHALIFIHKVHLHLEIKTVSKYQKNVDIDYTSSHQKQKSDEDSRKHTHETLHYLLFLFLISLI